MANLHVFQFQRLEIFEKEPRVRNAIADSYDRRGLARRCVGFRYTGLSLNKFYPKK